MLTVQIRVQTSASVVVDVPVAVAQSLTKEALCELVAEGMQDLSSVVTINADQKAEIRIEPVFGDEIPEGELDICDWDHDDFPLITKATRRLIAEA